MALLDKSNMPEIANHIRSLKVLNIHVCGVDLYKFLLKNDHDNYFGRYNLIIIT